MNRLIDSSDHDRFRRSRAPSYFPVPPLGVECWKPEMRPTADRDESSGREHQVTLPTHLNRRGGRYIAPGACLSGRGKHFYRREIHQLMRREKEIEEGAVDAFSPRFDGVLPSGMTAAGVRLRASHSPQHAI